MIKAVGKRLIVQEIELKKEEKKGVLIIPGQKEQMTVRVVAIGSEVDKNVELHDILFLPWETGIPVEVNGEVFLSVNENQILAAWRDK